MKKYRNEWKYCCTEKQLLTIEARTRGILSLDSHADYGGGYVVHSLYFDDNVCSCARDTEMGISERYKYRFRYYGNDLQTLRLERKEKKNGRCRKQTCPVSVQEFECIMRGQIEEVFWKTDSTVLKKFCVDVWKRGFAPKIIIDYERVAYVEEISNVRITFDKNITASSSTRLFLEGNYLAVPILEKDKHILEVKFDYILPGYIKKTVNASNLQQTSFSKYYIGLKRTKGIGR